MQGLTIGSKLIDSPVHTLNGEDTTLKVLAKGKKTMIFFLRDTSCVLAQAYIQALVEVKKMFDEMETKIVIVVNASVMGTYETLGKKEMPYEVVCDPKGGIYNMYGVGTAFSKEELGNDKTLLNIKKAYDAGYVHGTDTGDVLRLPAMFVFKSGKASMVHYGIFGDDLPEVVSLKNYLL